MSMKMKITEYGSSKQILAIPDHYVALGYKHDIATAEKLGFATLVDGRYIVKAGTIISENKDSKTIYKGIVLNDYDVTDGDAMMAVVVHGFIKMEAMPVAPNDTVKAALPMIHFIEKIKA